MGPSGNTYFINGVGLSGKAELPRALFARACLFCDLPEQSLRIGEFQHADPDAIGAVLSGDASGRQNESEITIIRQFGHIHARPLHGEGHPRPAYSVY